MPRVPVKQIDVDQDFDIQSNKLTNVATPTASGDATNKAYVDGLVNGLAWKNPCRVASQTNINLASAPASIDSTVMSNGDRVLVKSQTDQKENGIYDYNGAASAMTRSSDADTGAELEAAATLVQEGSDADNAYVQTTDSVTIGASNIVWVLFSSTGGITAGDGLQKIGAVVSIKEANDSVVADAEGLRAAVPVSDNKAMAGIATSSDDDPACGGIMHAPAAGSRVAVRINGVDAIVGNGTKVGVDCYFSDPGDTVAKTFHDIVAGDILRWIGSYAGYQIAVTDEIDYDYVTAESASSSSSPGA